jgi:hypothetical protein
MSKNRFKKRQKGALLDTSEPRPCRISAPGKLLGGGPAQGRLEGEMYDEVQQYRLDMSNAPPRLRVGGERFEVIEGEEHGVLEGV